MPTRIRLQRHGKKGNPFYWIVAMDSRTKRDGLFLEKLGTYNPNTNPATIELNLESAVKWLHNGAQPSETAKRILSYEGALLKHHLDKGVSKGALTAEQSKAKLESWLTEKRAKIEAKKETLIKASGDERLKRLQSERAYNEKRSSKAVAASAPAETSPEKEGENEVAAAQE